MDICRARRRCPAAMDLISALPDDILHGILIRLQSPAEAARTSVLSRRWRRVWAHVPALSFSDGDHHAPGTLIYDAIDAALDAYAAPALDSLRISIDDELWCHDPGARVSRWLRFAYERLVGELSLWFGVMLPWSGDLDPTLVNGVELPVCERATAIDLHFQHLALLLRFPAAGTFAALRVLRISSVKVEAGDLERAVSSQCPRLQELTLSDLVGAGDLSFSIRSESLERLEVRGQIGGQVTVQAPKLVRLEMIIRAAQKMHGVHIASRNLEEVIWHGTYDPRCHKIVEAGRHLRRLEVKNCYSWRLPMPTMAALVQRFDTIDELDVELRIPGVEFEYKGFWMDTAKLPRCKVLKIQLKTCGSHAFEAILLHLLWCSSSRKLDFRWLIIGKVPDYPFSGEDEHAGCSSCGRLGANGVVQDALEEAELCFSKAGFHGVHVEGLVKLLLRNYGVALRRLVIRAMFGMGPLSTETRERIAGICRPGTSVEFYT